MPPEPTSTAPQPTARLPIEVEEDFSTQKAPASQVSAAVRIFLFVYLYVCLPSGLTFPYIRHLQHLWINIYGVSAKMT